MPRPTSDANLQSMHFEITRVLCITGIQFRSSKKRNKKPRKKISFLFL